MKGLIIIAALCVLLASSQSIIPTFAEYVVQWNKTYSNTESVSRENIYNQRVALFSSLNTLYNMTSAANNFTDWTTDELNLLRGYKTKTNVGATTPYVNVSNPPSAFDWRSKNKVTSVRFQSTCGADWAFATVAYAESKLIIDGRQDTTINLSEQKIVECTTDSSCNSGYLESAMETAIKGIPSELIYPYSPRTTSVGICTVPGTNIGAKLEAYYGLTDDQLIQLLQERPVAVAVASKGWDTYNSGVFTCSATDTVDHAVLLIGYNSNYWIIKNSWGDKWGENGFMRISRTKGLNCQMGTVAVRTYGWHLTDLAALLLMTVLMMMF